MSDEREFFSDDEMLEALNSTERDVEPSRQHVSELRQLLHKNLQASGDRVHISQSHPTAVASSSRRGISLFAKFASIATVLTIVIFASRMMVGTATANLRSVLDATRMCLWIHAKTTVNYMGETSDLESWCSPQQRVAAFRSPQMMHFVDYQKGIQTSYSDYSGSIMHWRADLNSEEVGRAFVHALLHEGDLHAAFPLHHVSPVQKVPVMTQKQAKIRYSFQVSLKSQPSVNWETLVDVDPASGLIDAWEEVHAGGMHIITQFDYPATGPNDIYWLGVNRDAPIVDRVAGSDVVELAENLQRQVHDFDDYRALVVDQQLDANGAIVSTSVIRQVERVGERMQVHLIDVMDDQLSVPGVVDLSWWREHRDRFALEPLAECDGRVCKLYPYRDAGAVAVEAGLQPQVHKTTDFPVMRVKNDFGTTIIPIWPSIWPEHACRPMLMTTDPSLRFDIDPSGSEGPPNSIRLGLLSPENPFSKERAQYWFSLDRQHLLKSIDVRPSFESFPLGSKETRIITEYSNYARSPSGVTYATERISSNGDGSQRVKRTFIVDFDIDN